VITIGCVWFWRFSRATEGVSLGVALDGYPITGQRLQRLEQELGGVPATVAFYLQWPTDPKRGEIPLESLRAIADFGAVPVLTWEPMTIGPEGERAVLSSDILTGSYDDYIRRMAQGIASLTTTVWVRFAHEMNLQRYHWGSSEADFGPQSPDMYKRMYRYVVSRMRAYGGSNVQFIFCPNSESVPNEPWNKLSNYYPGDDVVDLLGLDGYSWEPPGAAGYREFRDIFLVPIEQLRRLSGQKPIWIFESATAGDDDRKRLWLSDAVRTASRWGIKGIVWFHARKEKDWRLPAGVLPTPS
jgi:hypothetical protein